MSNGLCYVENKLKADNGGVVPAEIPPGLVVEEVRSAGNLTKALALGRKIKQEDQPKKKPKKKPDAAVLEAWNDIATGNREGIFMITASRPSTTTRVSSWRRQVGQLTSIVRMSRSAPSGSTIGPLEQEAAQHLPKRPSKQHKMLSEEAVEKFDKEATQGLNIQRQRIVTAIRAKPREPEPTPEWRAESKAEPEKQQAPKPSKVRKCGPNILHSLPRRP